MYHGASGEMSERHRHRFEVNVHYRAQLEATGLRFSGMSPDGVLPEIVEYPDHPWFIGVQYHPELKSKPFAPHPLFAGSLRPAFCSRGWYETGRKVFFLQKRSKKLLFAVVCAGFGRRLLGGCAGRAGLFRSGRIRIR